MTAPGHAEGNGSQLANAEQALAGARGKKSTAERFRELQDDCERLARQDPYIYRRWFINIFAL